MFSISKNYAFVFKINHTTDAKYFTNKFWFLQWIYFYFEFLEYMFCTCFCSFSFV